MSCARCLSLQQQLAEANEELEAWRGNARDDEREGEDLQWFAGMRELFALTVAEAAIVKRLLTAAGRVHSKASLLVWKRSDWAKDEPESDRIIDVHICRIRKKFAARGLRNAIETVWGLGYRISPAFAERLKAASEARP